LGWGGDEQQFGTVLSLDGGVPQSARFRRTLELDDLEGVRSLQLTLPADADIRVHVNGVAVVLPEEADPSTGSDAAPTRTGALPLPSWPLLAMLYGFPLFWVTGLTLFVPVTFGSIMMLFLVLRGGLRTTPGMLCWLAFLAWVVVCAISVSGPMELVGYAQRTSDLMAVGIAFLYFINARESLSLTHLLRGLTVVWGTMVVLGLLATQFPDFRITTPLSRVMPGGLLRNELVRELVMPRLAEVQD